MLELTAGRIVTRYDSPLGLRHGPKFMVDGQTLVVVMFSTTTMPASMTAICGTSCSATGW